MLPIQSHFLHRVVALALGAWLSVVTLNHSVQAQERINVGDQVEFIDTFGDRYAGEVLRVLPVGQGFLVRYLDEDGDASQTMVRPNNIRLLVTEPEFRTWKSQKGNYSVKAKFVRADQETVTIEKEDGTTTDVKISLLSKDDRIYARKMRKAMGESGSGENASGEGGSGEFIRSIHQQPANDIDFSSAKKFDGLPPGSGFSPDALVAPQLAESISVQVPDRGNFHSSAETILVSSNRKIGMVVVENGMFDEKTIVLEMIDLSKNSSIGAFAFPNHQSLPVDIARNDKRLVSLVNDPLSGRPRIDVWKLEGQKILHEQGINLRGSKKSGGSSDEVDFSKGDSLRGDPRSRIGNRRGGPPGSMAGGRRGGAPGGFNEIEEEIKTEHRANADRCGFVNENTLYVKSISELFLVDIPTGKVLAVDSVNGFDPPAFSANRKFMAVHADFAKEILIVDCDALTVVAKIKSDNTREKVFSEDGTRLACVQPSGDQSKLVVYDIASGEQTAEVQLPFDVESMFWSGDDYVVMSNKGIRKSVVNATIGYPVVHYQNLGSINDEFVNVGNQTFVKLDDEAVIGEKYPDPNDVPEEVDLNKFFVQLQGNNVAVDVSKSEFGAGQRGRLRSHLEQAVRDAGGQLNPNARIKIVASTKKLPQKSEEYVTQGGRNRQSEWVKYTPYENKIVIMEGSTVVWESSMNSGGIGKNSGTLAEVQLAARMNSKPSLEFFLGSKIPARVPRADAWEKQVPTVNRSRLPGLGDQLPPGFPNGK